MKNKKSLGQIAFESYFSDEKSWNLECGSHKDDWERVAEAVEREVKKRSNNGWIHVSDRRPTKRDADKLMCVTYWDEILGHTLDDHYMNAGSYEYWQPCPKAPKHGKKGRR